MPNFAKIAETFGRISTAIHVGGTFGFVAPNGTVYDGFPTTLGERKMAALQGSGMDYEFSIVLPQVEINGSAKDPWTPQTDEMIEGSGVKYRIAAVSWQSTQTIIHFAKWLD